MRVHIPSLAPDRLEHLSADLPEVSQLIQLRTTALSHCVGTAHAGSQWQLASPMAQRLHSDSHGVSFLERILQRAVGGNILHGHAFPGRFLF